MDCSVVEHHLVAYHFGTCADDERARVDEHLVGCAGCLRAFLAIKHHVERGHAAEGAPRPSAALRARVRADVIAAVRPRLAVRVRRALRRPIPLYQGLAAALLGVMIVVAAPALLAKRSRAPRAAGFDVDTSRQSPASLAIY